MKTTLSYGWSARWLWAMALVLAGAAGGCQGSETAILLSVSIAPEDEGSLDGTVDALVFHVAVSVEGAQPPWVLDRAATGHRGEVTGRSLVGDPYRLLLHEDGDGLLETVQVYVEGLRGDQVVAWGTLESPDRQPFLKGRVAERRIDLRDSARLAAPFVIGETGCVFAASDGAVLAASPDDRDCDGARAEEDCDDGNPAVGPRAPEICGNGVDDNCNGTVDEVVDEDGDGYSNCVPVDCDDGNPDVHPGAVERCDGVDNDCDGQCDSGFDLDGDGFTDCGDGSGSQVDAAGACLGPPDPTTRDCDDADAAIYPGAPERCDGADNDCNGAVDELPETDCYDGPAGTAGVGLCRAGRTRCDGGVPGACLGQVLPAPEACNGLDDDCDGAVDQDPVTLTCGLGACRTSVPSCSNGTPDRCTPLAPQTEICNGVDDNCDGVVDEGCGCLHVAPFGDDTATGGQNDPLATINAAIARAVADPSGAQQVCVAAQVGCAWTFYHEQVVMADGVQVLGQYDPATWTRSRSCVTEIQSPAAPAVYFGPEVAQPTVLDGFVVSLNLTSTPAQSAAMIIEGSAGAVVGNSQIYGAHAGDTTVGIEVRDDAGTGTPAAPLIHHTLVEGGDGVDLSVGIHSVRSLPAVVSICDPADLDSAGRCLAGCGNAGLHIRGHRAGWSVRSTGVLLEDSPGAFIDQAMICTRASQEAAGVTVMGDAAGTVITRSTLGSWGADVLSVGLALEDCGGASPWIGDNASLWGEGGTGGNATSVGVAANGDCHPLLERNQLIVGGMEATSAVTFGVYCGRGDDSLVASRCSIVANVEIRGSTGGVPSSSVGVLCDEGACGTIRGNGLIHGRGGVDVVGLQLVGQTRAFVDANRIEGGCGTQSAVGLATIDAAGRVQNNAIRGGTCVQGTAASGLFMGALMVLGDSANEVDLHSNHVHGGGHASPGCTSIGLILERTSSGPSGPRGVLRNNVFEQGACGNGAVFSEADPGADPRVLEHNDYVPSSNAVLPLYLDEGSTAFTQASQINGLTDCQVGGNLAVAPGWSVGTSGFPSLSAASPLRNAGTAAGAPAWDWEGQPRPQESLPDIGPDEFLP